MSEKLVLFPAVLFLELVSLLLMALSSRMRR